MSLQKPWIQNVREAWDGTAIGPAPHWRERRMLMLGSGAMLIMGIGWGIFFSIVGNWVLVDLDLVMVVGSLRVGALNSSRTMGAFQDPVLVEAVPICIVQNNRLA